MTLTRAMAKKKEENQTTTGAGAGADQFRSSSDTPITEVQSNIPTSCNDNVVVNKTVIDDLGSEMKQQNLKIDANTKAISEMHDMITEFSELSLLAKKGSHKIRKPKPKPKPRNLAGNKRKSLDAVEFEDRRSKGLCYFCGETVVTGRKCCCRCSKRPRFYHIDFEEQTNDEEEEEDEEEESESEDDDLEEEEEEEEEEEVYGKDFTVNVINMMMVILIQNYCMWG